MQIKYKRCAVLQQEYGILCYWNPEKKKVVFCEQWGLPFGAVASAQASADCRTCSPALRALSQACCPIRPLH
jgi:hypothetical protein